MGINIVSLALPMPPADAGVKAAAELMLPMSPPHDGGRTPPSPCTASLAEGKDREDDGEVDNHNQEEVAGVQFG